MPILHALLRVFVGILVESRPTTRIRVKYGDLNLNIILIARISLVLQQQSRGVAKLSLRPGILMDDIVVERFGYIVVLLP
jgi:hypothetical protein